MSWWKRLLGIPDTKRNSDASAGGNEDLAVRELSDREVEKGIRRLRDTNPRIRAGSALVLGEYRVRKAVEPLIACLKDDNLIVVGACARALGQIGDKRAIPELVNTLHRLLDRYKCLEAAQYLACAYKGLMRSDWRKWCASAAQPVLVGSISPEEQKVLEVLEEVGHDLEVSMQLLGGLVHMEIMMALAKLDAPKALSAIGEVLDTCRSKYRWLEVASKALGASEALSASESQLLLEEASEALEELMRNLPDDPSLRPKLQAIADKLMETAHMKIYFAPYEHTLQQGWQRTRTALLKAHSSIHHKIRKINSTVRRTKGGFWNTFLSWFGV